MTVSLRYLLSSFIALVFALFYLTAQSQFQVPIITLSFLLFGGGLFFLEYEKPANSSILWTPWILLSFVLGVSLIRMEHYPSYTDDFFRYFWDAILFDRGVNPYSAAPTETVSLFRDLDKLFPFLNSKEYYSVYPPTTQLFFKLAYSFPAAAQSVEYFMIRYQIFYTMFFVISGYLYALWLKGQQQDLNLTWFLAFMLCPLFIFYNVFELHTDYLAAGFLLAGVFAFHRGFPVISGILLSLSVWAKLHPVFILPFLLIQPNQSLLGKSNRKFIAAFLIVSVLLWLPFYAGFNISGFLSSVRLYYTTFEYHSFLYAGLLNAADNNHWWWIKANTGFILSVIFAFPALFFLYFSAKSESLNDRLIFGLYTYIFYLIFSSTIHPWYFTLPLMLVFITRTVPLSLIVWIIFSSLTDMFRQAAYSPDQFWGFRSLVYGSVFILLGLDLKEHLLPLIMKIRAKDKWKRIESFAGNSHLDVGSHEGLLLSSASPSVFAVATDIRNYRNHSAVSYVVQPEHQLPFKSGSFETSSAVFVLHHAVSPEVLIAEMKRVTSKRIIVIESLSESKFQTDILTILDQIANIIRSGGKMDPNVKFRSLKYWTDLLGDGQWNVTETHRFGWWAHPTAQFILEKQNHDL